MRPSRIAALVLVAMLVAGAVVAVTYTVVSPEGGWFGDDYDDDAALVDAWCDNVGEAFSGADHGPRSFVDLMRLAGTGRLRQPPRPPATDPAALDRWQAEHSDYETSSYLTLLKGYPREVTFAHSAFVRAMEQAHSGERVDPAFSVGMVRQLDEYRSQHCGRGST